MAGLLAAGAQVAPAQELMPLAASPQPVRVLVVDFIQSDPIPEMGDLGTIAAGLVRLRLLEVPALEVHRVASAPPCGAQASNPMQREGPAAQRSRPGSVADNFYVVQGAVGVHAPNLLVDYSLQHCANGVFETLIHEAQPFTADRALEQISVISNFIMFKMADLVPTVKVTIAISQNPEEKDIGEGLRLKLTETITDISGLEVTNSGEYVIQGRITVQKPSRFPHLPVVKSKSNNLKMEDLKILAHGKPYPLKSVLGLRDKPSEFYSQVIAEVRDSLPQVLLAERLGWPGLLDNMTAEDLLEKGKQFLCIGEPLGCKNDVPSAIPVLIRATDISPKDPEARLLLGRAQLLSGQNVEAVKTLEEALRIEEAEKKQGKKVTLDEEVTVLNLLGDAHSGSEKYDNAIRYYDRSLNLDPSQPKIYDKKALASLYGGNRLAALQTLIEGLHQAGGSKSASSGLKQSAHTLIQRLGAAELPSAEVMLKEAYEIKKYPVNDEYAYVLDREGSEVINVAQEQEEMNRARHYLQRAMDVGPREDSVRVSVLGDLTRSYLGNDLQKADSFLTEAEHVPSEHLTANLRAWILELRAWYWIDEKNYEKAYDVAQNAHDTEHSRWSDTVLAKAALNLGKTKQQKATADGANRKQLLLEAEKLFQQTINLLDLLISDRVGDADQDYLEASHSLGRDNEALLRYQKIVEQRPRDAAALRSIMFICNEYLFQPECAYKATMQDVEVEAPSADTYLNAIEIAALQGKNDQAGQWLGILFTLKDATAYQKAIGYFYRLWLAAGQNNNEAEKLAFRGWEGAIGEFRKTRDDSTWSFEGARHVLEHSAFDSPTKGLLTSMIAAIENRDKPLPAFSPR